MKLDPTQMEDWQVAEAAEENAKPIKQLADELCGGKTVFFLEGGYNLKVLSCMVNSTFNIWLGENYFDDPLGLPPYNVRANDLNDLIVEIKKRHGLY